MTDDLNNSRMKAKRLHVVEQGGQPADTCPKGALTMSVGREIIFNPAILDTFSVTGFLPVHYDLMLLCAAIEFADRRWRRPRSWSRDLHVTMPVIDLGAWRRREVHESLQSALRHLTGDQWRLSFAQAENPSPLGERQRELTFLNTKTFVIPYSDGLDSRAVAALSGAKHEALCVRVAKHRQHHRPGDNYFAQIPFKVHGHGSNESSFRSRGFQFCAVAAIAAHLSKLKRIAAPESGQGALGPVLLPLHNIYPDYRNHPTFLRKMERFIEALLGHSVQYEQPRLWYTKGQTLRAFLALPGKLASDLTNTRSCWQNRRIVNSSGRKRHCGLCAACLLRRQSLHAVAVSETQDTYVVPDLGTPDVLKALSGIPARADRNIMVEYGSVGARHLQHLADMAVLPSAKLRAHVSELAIATSATPQETLKNLRTLLTAHAKEWRAFLAAQGERSFLKRWTQGGRHG